MTVTNIRYANMNKENGLHGVHSDVLPMIMQEVQRPEGAVTQYRILCDLVVYFHNEYLELHDQVRELGGNKRKKNKTMDVREIARMHKAHYNAMAIDYFLYLVNPDYRAYFGITKNVDAEANIRTLLGVADTMLHASGTYNGFQTILWWHGGCEMKRKVEGYNSEYNEKYSREDLGLFFF